MRLIDADVALERIRQLFRELIIDTDDDDLAFIEDEVLQEIHNTPTAYEEVEP